MVDLMTEDEQIIALKTWWRNYGLLVIGGVIAGLVIFFGWSMWQTKQTNLRSAASLDYQSLVDNLLAGDIVTADKQITEKENAALPMPYSMMEQWLFSEVEVKKQNIDDAVTHLQQALALSNDSYFQQLSRVRLARLYILQDKPQEALDTVTLKDDKTADQNPEILLARGDAYAALGDYPNARKAYESAWDIYPTLSPQRQLITMLIAELPASQEE